MKGQQYGEVNDAFIAKWQKSYRDFVDAHRMDDAGIHAAMKKWGEEHEIEDILYDMDYFYQGFAVGDVVLRLPLVSYLVLTAGIAGCLWGIYKCGSAE